MKTRKMSFNILSYVGGVRSAFLIEMSESNKNNCNEIVACTGLDLAQVETLKKCFDSTDKEGNGFISATAIQMIFKSLGVPVQKAVLDEAISELGDQMDANKFEFGNFCQVASRFMLEEDEEGMREELKEAFRIYDKEGNGYITTDILKEILHEIDPELTSEDLDNIIEEVDEDGSGTLDFDEFQEMMMG